MKVAVKATVRLLAIVLGWILAATVAQAAEIYPSKPIRMIVPYPPGGASDIIARMLGQKLSGSLGQPVVIENRAGAGGNIGADAVAKAPPDGYTLLMGNIGPNAISPGLYKTLPFDPIKDFTPISLVSAVPIVLVVHPSLPIKTVKDLIALATATPGRFAYASAGVGSSNHLAMELFKSMANVDLLHVPYKGGGPAMTDLIGGQIGIAFDTLPVVLSHVRSGKLRAIAIAGTRRSELLPGVPTVAESGLPGYSASSWGGVMGPAGMPPAIVSRLNAEIIKVLKQSDFRERLAAEGIEVMGSTPDEFGSFLKAEISKWTIVINTAGIKAE
jgi:tripartite-type tricarboxylate transporter receptor subunit TctC